MSAGNRPANIIDVQEDWDHVWIEKTNIFGSKRRMKFSWIDYGKITEYWYRVDNGSAGLIQEELADLTDDQREFLLTGLAQDDWDALGTDEDFEEE